MSYGLKFALIVVPNPVMNVRVLLGLPVLPLAEDPAGELQAATAAPAKIAAAPAAAARKRDFLLDFRIYRLQPR
jgi:hypothetical protein